MIGMIRLLKNQGLQYTFGEVYKYLCYFESFCDDHKWT